MTYYRPAIAGFLDDDDDDVVAAVVVVSDAIADFDAEALLIWLHQSIADISAT